MLRTLLLTIVCSFTLMGSAFAQGALSGVVTDARTGETMPGVNILIEELGRGAATNVDGEYTISNIPSGSYTLRVTFVGYRQHTVEVEIGTGDVEQNFAIERDITGLDEVVVTGVGRGTQTKKLGFSVSKINESELQKVPAANVGSALYGKTSGVTIVSASGDPASAPSIRLRGSTSINGGQEPLIIVDGIITDGSLQDINMQDVESMEVVKGAAAASLYGSLAGNGVIQILTKTASDGVGNPSVTVRTEYGVSEIAKDYPVATTHPWVNDAELTEDGKYIDSWSGYGTYNSDRAWNNEFPVQYNNVDAIFTGKPFNSNYIRIGGTAEDFNYMASFENLNQSGVVENLPEYTRNSVRFNGDYNSTDDFSINFKASYIDTEYPYFSEQGQGANYFYSALTAPPYVNLLEKNAEGDYSNQPTGYSISGSNWQNPLYVAKNMERNTNRDRFIGGVTLNYNIADWISVHARQSLDNQNVIHRMHTPVGYQTPTPSTFYNNGYESIQNVVSSTKITEAWTQFDQTLAGGDVNVNGTLKYLYENRDYNEDYTRGYNYAASGIRQIEAIDPATLYAYSEIQKEKVVNYIANVDVDYQDKFIVGAMLRRDGSSLFGEDERYKYYYRGSLAYRLTEDFDINNVDELKLRLSHGTSGQRPPFNAQYETYSIEGAALVAENLGNSEISPSVVAETELGMDMTFFNRFNFTANYALTNVTNDYLLVPLSGTSPFEAQWKNVGEIENTSLEFELGGQLISQQDLTWNLDLAFSKNTQTVTDLGEAPAFTRGTGSGYNAALDLFRFEEGVPYGTMYGNKLISSVDELTVVNGEVVNIPGGYAPSDFTVNELGHVVLADAQGTIDERPMFLVDENGDPVVTDIGDTNPDFNLGFSSDFNYKGLGLYMIWDLSVGGDVYNYTRQLMYNRYLHKDLETYTAEMGLDPQYAVASDGLYNGSEAISHFVEDGSYLKLREASVSYTFNNEMLGALGNYIRDIQFSVVGRNLLTITDYSGFDPEVALRSNASNFRLDEFSYPNFRTYSGSVQVRF